MNFDNRIEESCRNRHQALSLQDVGTRFHFPDTIGKIHKDVGHRRPTFPDSVVKIHQDNPLTAGDHQGRLYGRLPDLR